MTKKHGQLNLAHTRKYQKHKKAKYKVETKGLPVTLSGIKF